MLEKLFNQSIKRFLLFTFIGAVAAFTIFGVLNTASAYDSGSSGGAGDSDFLGGGRQGDVKSVDPQNVEVDDDGYIVVDDPTVTLYVQFVGNPTHYQLCEDQLFKECQWKRLRFDGKITFTLSEGAGLKKVYLRARFLNRPGETKVLNVKYVPK